MGLCTWAWPSCEGLRMGTQTSPGPRMARLGLNKSPLITGRLRRAPGLWRSRAWGWVLCQGRLCWIPCFPPGRPRRKPQACLASCMALHEVPILSSRFLLRKMGYCTFRGRVMECVRVDFSYPFPASNPGSARFLLCGPGKSLHLSDPSSLTQRAGVLQFTFRGGYDLMGERMQTA